MAAEHRLISVASRSATELPLSAVLVNGAIDVYPQVESKGLLFLQFHGGKVRITAGKYIGLIPLTPHISVEVRPKLPVSNLARVLDYASASLGSVTLDRFYEQTENQGSTVLEFLLSNLISALRKVQEHGYLKSYIRREDAGLPKGRLLAGHTMKTLWSRGERHKVATEAFEQTVDVPANRVIRHAMECAMTSLRRARPTSPVLRLANALHADFPRAVTEPRSLDLVVSRSILRTRSLPPTRGYYYRPLEIASLILSRASVSLEVSGGSDIQLETFILDFEDVFERYLRRVLERGAPGACSVKDGNDEGSRSLYDDRPEPPAQPDIVIERSGEPPLIVEVKYKDKPDRADVNQVVTYAACYRSKSVVLVHQAKAGAQTDLKLRGTINGVRVYAYGFNLAAENLDAQEAAFSSAVFALIADHEVEVAA